MDRFAKCGVLRNVRTSMNASLLSRIPKLRIVWPVQSE